MGMCIVYMSVAVFVQVAACELLHSMSLFLIGKGAILPESTKDKVCWCLVQLSVTCHGT